MVWLILLPVNLLKNVSWTVTKKYKPIFLNEWFNIVVFIEMSRLNTLEFCYGQIILLTELSASLFCELQIPELNFIKGQNSDVVVITRF